jgi:hypothetical protein
MKTNSSSANRTVSTTPPAFGWRCATILLLLLFAARLAVKAQDFSYSTENGAIIITGYNGSGGSVTIPGAINGYPVTVIGTNAFLYRSNLTGVTIPDSVTIIEDGAFAGCTNLNSVTIPSSVTTIGWQAFAGATSLVSVTIPNGVISIGIQAFGGSGLKSIVIPDTVTTIGDWAFFGCISLTNVTVGKSVTSIGAGAFHDCFELTAITVDAFNSAFGSMDGVLFDKRQTELIHWPQGKDGVYTIPNSVTSLGSFTDAYLTEGHAFGTFFYSSLTSVTIGSGLTNIPGYEFSASMSLTNITIPASVTEIGDIALAECSSLTGAYFQGNAPHLGSDVFRGDDNAIIYYLPGTTGWDTTFAGRPTAPWVLPYPVVLDSSVHAGTQSGGFGFIISWATNLPVVVEASTNLANSVWTPVGTNTLTDGWSNFSDSQWMNYPGRFYRVRSP